MVVLRAGASRVFFDVVGTFQAQNMLQDTEAAVTTMNAIVIDGLSGMEESGAMVAEQMQKIVEATVPLSHELEMATLEFQKFVSAAEGGRLADEVKQVGLQFGFTSQESLEAGARMAQLSSMIGENAVPAATEMALAFGLIGDMTPETAMLKLINLQQQTAFVFDGTTKAAYDQLTAEEQRLKVRQEMANVLNTLNKVEDNSAATMSKITGVMNEFASQAHLAGEEISMMAAMSATLIEAGEEQGKGGRALRMIYARLGADTSGAASFLQELGVETETADGSLRALSDILADLNPHWEKMTAGQKQTTAQMVAGNRHYVRFIKLAENYERIQQLNNATMGDMGAVYNESGEAVGFLNEMMNSNAVALDAAEAKLELVNAQIGDFFIPTVIDATEFQALFNQEILNMLEASGSVGDTLQGFFEFQQIMSSTFAPFFSAVINVKAMNVAMMTQRQIMRALNGETIAATTKTKAARNTEIAQVERIEQQHKEMIGLTKQERIARVEADRKAIEGNEKKIAANKEQRAAIQTVIAAIEKQEIVETDLLALQIQAETFNNKRNRAMTHRKKNELIITDAGLIKGKASAQVKGTQAKRTKELEIATEDLILTINEELLSLDREDAKLERRNNKLRESAMVTDITTGAVIGLKPALDGTTVATERQTQAIMKLSMFTMKIGMAFFAAEMAVMMFKDSIPGVRSEAHAARIAFILMGMGMAIMTAEMIFSTQSMIGNTVAKTGNSLASFIAAGANAILTAAFGATTAATTTATAAVTIFSGILSGGIMVAGAIAIAVAVDRYLLPKLKETTEAAIDTTAALDESGEATAQYAADVNAAFGDIDMSVFDEGASKIKEFDNAREELFFGFKAGQVTGDLIKQVQQKGVENFVANTEIIMNNTFNGLTTDELAEEVISQIERRAGIGGINTAIA
jgi:TP901 family phage tail tape measure protein|tara:strand:- start:21052 stop:23820 length:2769 start_codon:yes stop_codon:yes gene_type:complete